MIIVNRFQPSVPFLIAGHMGKVIISLSPGMHDPDHPVICIRNPFLLLPMLDQQARNLLAQGQNRMIHHLVLFLFRIHPTNNRGSIFFPDFLCILMHPHIAVQHGAQEPGKGVNAVLGGRFPFQKVTERRRFLSRQAQGLNESRAFLD